MYGCIRSKLRSLATTNQLNTLFILSQQTRERKLSLLLFSTRPTMPLCWKLSPRTRALFSISIPLFLGSHLHSNPNYKSRDSQPPSSKIHLTQPANQKSLVTLEKSRSSGSFHQHSSSSLSNSKLQFFNFFFWKSLSFELVPQI